MDQKQCHVSDRKGASNRLASKVLTHGAETVNSATEDIHVVKVSFMTVYRDRIKTREGLLVKLDKVVAEATGSFQLQFDGKKINKRERLAACLELVDKDGCR